MSFSHRCFQNECHHTHLKNLNITHKHLTLRKYVVARLRPKWEYQETTWLIECGDTTPRLQYYVNVMSIDLRRWLLPLLQTFGMKKTCDVEEMICDMRRYHKHVIMFNCWWLAIANPTLSKKHQFLGSGLRPLLVIILYFLIFVNSQMLLSPN